MRDLNARLHPFCARREIAVEDDPTRPDVISMRNGCEEKLAPLLGYEENQAPLAGCEMSDPSRKRYRGPIT